MNGDDHNRKLWEFHHSRRASTVQVNPILDSLGGDEQDQMELPGLGVDLDMRTEKIAEQWRQAPRTVTVRYRMGG